MHTFRRFIALALIAALLTPLVAALFPGRAYAAYDATQTLVKDQAFSYMAYRMFTYGDSHTCANRWAGSIDAADVQSMKWFAGFSSENVARGGMLIMPTDGTGASCGENTDQWIAKALALWGWGDSSNFGEFLKAIDYRDNSDGSYSNQGVNGSTVGEAIRAKYYGSKTPQLTSAMKYYIYLQAFTAGCGGTSTGKAYATAPDEERTKANTDPNMVHFYSFPDGAKTPVDTIWTMTKTRDTMVTIGYMEGGDFEDSCAEIAGKLLNFQTLSGGYAQAIAANSQNALSLPASTSTSGGTTSLCGIEGALAWIACPITTALQKFAEYMRNTLMELLYLPLDGIFGTKSSSDGFRSAWVSFRNIALGMVAIAAIVMIISQAMGLGLLDAYTIRKLLPRIFIVMIGILLSWPLMKFIVTFFNDIGQWTHTLLLAPFGGLVEAERTASTILINYLGMGAVAVGGTIWALSLGALGILALLGVIVLALLVGLTVLAIRQLVIILCIITAPLAIACYILPGTQKVWTFWKNALITSLMMFPIVMGFISAGEIMAKVSMASGSTYANLLAILMYFAPYAMLPFAFKLAGGLMSTIFSIANDRSKGLFDRSRKFREGQHQKNRAAMKQGRRFAGGNETNFRGRLNRGIGMASNASAISASGSLTTPRAWGNAMRGRMGTLAMAEAAENADKNMDYQAWKGDDGLNRAASEANDRSELRALIAKYDSKGLYNDPQTMEKAISQIETVRRQMSPEAFRQMTTLSAIAGGTAYDTAGEAWAAVAKAAGNDGGATGALIAKARSASMGAGRVDVGGAGFGTTLTQVLAMQEQLRQKKVIDQATMDNVTDNIRQDVYDSQGGATLVHSSMKPTAVKQMSFEMNRRIADAQQNGSTRDMAQEFASLAAVYDGLQSSSPAKAKIIADSVMNQAFDVNKLNPEQLRLLDPVITTRDAKGNATSQKVKVTYKEAIDALRSNPEFQQMRREYQSQIDAVQAQAVLGQQQMQQQPGAQPGGTPGALNP